MLILCTELTKSVLKAYTDRINRMDKSPRSLINTVRAINTAAMGSAQQKDNQVHASRFMWTYTLVQGEGIGYLVVAHSRLYTSEEVDLHLRMSQSLSFGI